MIPKREDLIPGLMNRFRLTGAFAEVGVERGEFAQAVLARWTGRGPYYAVDPFTDKPPAAFETYPALANEREAHARIGSDPRVNFLKTDSVSAAQHIKDGELDGVYIDAGHSFSDVTRDLETWYPKVRDGGLIAGHDYVFTKYIQCQLAVDLFARKVGAIPRFNCDPWPTWWFWKGPHTRTIGVTAYTPGWKGSEWTKKNRADHALASGSLWHVEEWPQMSLPEALWKKVDIIRDMAKQNPGAWIVWFDADAIVTDLRRPLSDLVGWSPHDAIVTVDPIGGINLGVCAFRANGFPPIYEKWVNENPALWRNRPNYENDAFADLIRRDALANVEIVHHRLCNGYPEYDLWGGGDFVAHFPGSMHTAAFAREFTLLARAKLESKT